jgi:hypothetical protein
VRSALAGAHRPGSSVAPLLLRSALADEWAATKAPKASGQQALYGCVSRYKRATGHQSNCSYSYSYSYRLRSFTFYSLNWMYDAFYPNKTRKVIPDFINIYLTPLALAV